MSFKPPSYSHQLFTIQLPNQFAQNRTILYLCTQSALSQILQPLHNLRYAVRNELLKDFHPSTRPIPPLLSGTLSNSHSVSLFLHFVQDRKSKFYRNTYEKEYATRQKYYAENKTLNSALHKTTHISWRYTYICLQWNSMSCSVMYRWSSHQVSHYENSMYWTDLTLSK